MQAIVNNKLLDKARLMASKAKDGTMKHGNTVYIFTFDHSRWVYNVKDSEGQHLGDFNFKSLNEAKKYVQWYLNN